MSSINRIPLALAHTAKPLRHCLEQLVSDQVTEGVVNQFELVEVEKENREMPVMIVALGLRQRKMEEFGEQLPVWQTCQ